MRKCKTCPTVVANAKTYCTECSDIRRLNAILKQTEDRKRARKRAGEAEEAEKAEKATKLPSWMLVRGLISRTGKGTCFG